MDTSASSQLNKPTFGTSDFAVSAADSREYIDAAAEDIDHMIGAEERFQLAVARQ